MAVEIELTPKSTDRTKGILLGYIASHAYETVKVRCASPVLANRIAGIVHRLGGESGERNRRLVDCYRAHPNAIRELHTGQAFVVETRPEHRVRKVRVSRLNL